MSHDVSSKYNHHVESALASMAQVAETKPFPHIEAASIYTGNVRRGRLPNNGRNSSTILQKEEHRSLSWHWRVAIGPQKVPASHACSPRDTENRCLTYHPKRDETSTKTGDPQEDALDMHKSS